MSDYKSDFFAKYASAAIEEQKRYGIPASVTLAQMAVESGFGRSSLAREDNNYFGIKVSSSWLKAGKPWSYHSDDRKDDRFCRFTSALDSMEYHSKILMNNRYRSCRQYASTDHYNWIKGIKSGGYATDPNYVSTIEGVIKRYGLDKYDRQAVEEAQRQGISIGYMQKGGAKAESIAQAPTNESTKLTAESTAKDNMLSSLTQSDDPKQWLAYLMQQDTTSSISHSADPIGALIGTVFSGLMLMAAQLDMDETEESEKQKEQLKTIQEKEETIEVIDRTRTESQHIDHIQTDKVISASALYESGIQNMDRQQQAIAIK